jgi:hypothetical protein
MKRGAFISSILLLGVLLLGSQITYAGPNPGIPVDSHLSGPAIVGTITITPTTDPLKWNINFSGQCKGNPAPFSVMDYPAWHNSIIEITEADLDQQFLGDVAQYLPPGCAKPGVNDLIINTVSRLTKTDSAAQAEVVILQIVYK